MFDTSKIEGFEEMSESEKLNAVLNFEAPKENSNKDEEVEKLKTLLSKANSESANYKRQLREKQSEQEQAQAEREEADRQKDEELKTLRREKTVSLYQEKLIGNGYDVETAKTMANSLPDGVDESYFKAQGEFLAKMKQEIKSNALDSQPDLSIGEPLSEAEKQKNDLRKWAGL